MSRACLIPLLTTVLVACAPPPPEVPDREVEILRIAYPTLLEHCVERFRREGQSALAPAFDDPRDCFEMQEQRRWKGLFEAVFEGGKFCPQPADDCYFEIHGKNTCLTFVDGTAPDVDLHPVERQLYRLEFDGRMTSRDGKFCHLGVSDRHIVVEKLISFEPVD